MKAKGVRYARLIYILNILKFFRPYTIKKPDFLNLFIHYIMIGSYLKTSRRSLVRPGFSGDARVNKETILPFSAWWADNSFIETFTFPMLEGDPVTALR